MKKLKEIEVVLKSKHIPYFRDGNNRLIIEESCALGDNFYDYGEVPKKLRIDDPELRNLLLNDWRITILRCEDCCCCAGW